MAKIIKRTVYLLSVGQRYLDRDGDPVEGWDTAINFGNEQFAEMFIEENPAVAARHPRIVSREFTDTDLMTFVKAEGRHLRMKKGRPEE